MKIGDVAVLACHEAGKELMVFFGRKLTAERKKDHTPVTVADIASNNAITEFLLGVFPDHHILSEEGNIKAGLKRGLNWIIDPLDGTSNFMHGLPYFCVSIACVEVADDGKVSVLAGAIYNPATDELYTAEKGKGAYFRGKRLEVSETTNLSKAFVACGYHGDDITKDYGKSYIDVSKKVEGSRRLGAAALDLAKTAQGVFDLFFDPALRPWDIAAGSIMVQEAGGCAVNFPGNGERGDFCLLERGIVAGNKKMVTDAMGYFD